MKRKGVVAFCILAAMSLAFIAGCGTSDDSSQATPAPAIVRGGPVADTGESAPVGQVNVYDELAEQIKANGNKNALFVVKVVLCGVTNDIAKEQEKIHDAYMDARNAPIVQEYWEQYDEWSRIPIEKLDADAARFRRNEKYVTDSFYAYWVSTHTEEEKAAYDAAWAVVQEKYNTYISMYDSVLLVAQKEKTFEEANRLQDEGLMLVWKEYTEMVGFLTEEQITQFPVNESYGYYITWAEIPENGSFLIDQCLRLR